jgi:hypothetical protein
MRVGLLPYYTQYVTIRINWSLVMDNLLCIQQYKFSLFVCTFVDDGYLKEFIAKTRTMSPEERGAHLEKDEGITEAHEGSAQEGQTEAPKRDASVDLHFIALVLQEGHIYELDGRKPFPINHGPSTLEGFLQVKPSLTCSLFHLSVLSA